VLSGKTGLILCLQDGYVDCGVGRNWCGGRKQAIHPENYKKLLQAKTSVLFFKFRTASMSVFVSLSLGLEEIFIIHTVSCLASSAITKLHLHQNSHRRLGKNQNMVKV